MSLLALESVGKHYRRGPREHTVLRNVNLQLQAGELTVIWGQRRSGRTTLLRIAAGIEEPDEGVVRFLARDLRHGGERTLGNGIGFCQKPIRSESRSVLEHVMLAPLARGAPPTAARARAANALERTGTTALASALPGELDTAETVRVALARTLALHPRLLVIDEPTAGVEHDQRDDILALLRSLADEGIAVLASTGESPALSGADRACALGEGELRESAQPEPAQILPFKRAS